MLWNVRQEGKIILPASQPNLYIPGGFRSWRRTTGMSVVLILLSGAKQWNLHHKD